MESFKVKKMFENIAFSYDLQNCVLSVGRDSSWRKALARHIRIEGKTLILDAATGTGEICLEICRHLPGVRVIGLDFSPRMLSLAKKKIESSPVGNRASLALGDGRFLPLKAGSVDAVTMAFGIRNIIERRQVLEEFRRVLKDRGQLLIMEFDLPEKWPVGPLYRFYFDHVLPPLGNWLSRTDYAYTYLVQSVYDFPEEEKFCKEIEGAGFKMQGTKEFTFGIAKLYEAVKV